MRAKKREVFTRTLFQKIMYSVGIMQEQSIDFEEAMRRLEEIVDLMNAPSTSLDASLKLYEEADTLMRLCERRINEVEKRIRFLADERAKERELAGESV